MGFQYNSASSAVTVVGSVSVGYTQPTSTQTSVSYASGGTITVNTTPTVIYTPTAGKTFYLCGCMMNNGGNGQPVCISDNGTPKYCQSTNQPNMGGCAVFNAPIPFTTNVQLLTTSGSVTTLSASVWGFEA